MIDPTKIAGSEKVTGVFGRWPQFHDARVLWLRLDSRESSLGKGPTLEALIHGFEMTSEIDAKGFFVQRNHIHVHIRFSGAKNIKLSTLSPMILFELSIDLIEEPDLHFKVGFDTVSDSDLNKDISFLCAAIEVIEVVPCDEKGNAAA